MTPDPNTLATAELSDLLRRVLRGRPEPPQLQAAALAYELAALIGRHAASPEQADMVINVWTTVMREQVAQFGVGVEHP